MFFILFSAILRFSIETVETERPCIFKIGNLFPSKLPSFFFHFPSKNIIFESHREEWEKKS